MAKTYINPNNPEERYFVENPEMNTDLVAGYTAKGFIPQDKYTPGVVDSSALNTQTPINFNTPTNTSPYPVSGLDTTTNQMTALPQETQQSDIIKQTQELYKQLSGESSYRAEQEQKQGLEALTKTKTDLSNQLKALQNEALQIPLQIQQEAVGRGVTAGGMRPVETAALRNNAIQALGISSLLEASKNNIATAQSFADRAVSQKFDPIEAEINANLKNLDLLSKDPSLTLAQQNRLQAQQTIQDNRKATADKQKEDMKTAQALATAAMTLNPNDATAQYNAQQVMKLNPTQPNYLQQVFNLVGKYQQDPAKLAKELLDAKLISAQTALAWANVQKAKDLSSVLSISDATKLGVPYGTTKEQAMALGKTPGVTEQDAQTSLAQLTFLKDTVVKAKELSSAAGRSGIRKTVEGLFVGSTNFTRLVSQLNTLKTNTLTLMTDPVVKKFFGPQMSEADVKMMMSGGTTLDAESQNPEDVKSELERLNTLYDKMETTIEKGMTSMETSLEEQVKTKGFDYNKMKSDGLTDEQIKQMVGL